MFFRKQSVAPPPWKEKDMSFKIKNPERQYDCIPSTSATIFTPQLIRSIVLTLVTLSAWFLALTFFFRTSPTQHSNPTDSVGKLRENEVLEVTRTAKSLAAPVCNRDLSVYVYDLPRQFNLGLLSDCAHLNIYTNMCPHVANRGLGQPLSSSSFSTPFSPSPWFATHQFLAEMIFHARMETHPCRTRDPSQANLFYVPFYGGLHASSKFRESNLTARDELAVQMVEYLQSQPWFRRNHGNDHFLALGRTAWDFMRTDGVHDFGANSLLNLEGLKNVSVLTVERNPWRGSNQFGIPYSTCFHPFSQRQVASWQYKMMTSSRPHLFSFIGGPRKGVEKAAVRNELINQCGVSSRCELLQCTNNGSSYKCHQPSEVLKLMSQSQFCLQAPGDSFTRRSTFDAIIAGCIPVFFSPHTAYTQYKWYFPEDWNTYSVFIEALEKKKGEVRIEEELLKIPVKKVEKMRHLIIQELIPRISYAHPNATAGGVVFEDAVDVALAALGKRIRPLRHGAS